MSLSPLEIRNQEFGKSPMGFKRDEVKLFLAQVAETVAELSKERDQLVRRAESLMKRISELEAQSSAIGQALELAKKESGQILEQARYEAQKVRDSADYEAQKIIDGYAVKINETKQLLYELNVIKDSYFRKLLGLLEKQEESIRRFEDEYESRRITNALSNLPQNFRVDYPLSDIGIFSNAIHRRKRDSLFGEE
jgi:cell division initiation protein